MSRGGRNSPTAPHKRASKAVVYFGCSGIYKSVQTQKEGEEKDVPGLSTRIASGLSMRLGGKKGKTGIRPPGRNYLTRELKADGEPARPFGKTNLKNHSN
jgi:hypothetical protein